MRPDLRNLKQYFLNLGGEYVHAPDYQHIVGTAGQIFHTDRGSAAWAWLIHQFGNVLGAVSDHGQGFFPQTGHHQFPFGAWGKYLPGFGINNLRYKPILIHMHSLKLFTLTGDTGSAQFTHTVVLSAQEALTPDSVHLIPHRLCHSLSAEQSDMYFQILLRVNSHGPGSFPQMQCIGRRGYQQGSPHILHKHNLFLCIAGRHGNYCGADVFQTCMKPQGPCEQSVPESDLYNVFACCTSHTGNPGHIVSPDMFVILCIPHHRRLSSGS